jgi:peptidyl-prolyl cis-trans isomerase C
MRTCILIAVCAVACRAQLLPKDVPQSASSSSTAAPAAPLAQDTVVAKIAGVSITVGDVTKLMKFAPPNLQQLFQQNPQQAISTAYQMKYLEQEAEKQHLDQKDPTKETLEAVLEWQKENILANAMVNEMNNGFQVTEEMINDFYKKNQARWESANIKIILIGFKPSPLPGDIKPGQSADDAVAEAAKKLMEASKSPYTRTQDEARVLAGDLVKQLRAGADFAKLVEKYSDDKESKASGGDFGAPIKTTSSYGQEIKKVVFAMKPGEISDPVQEGYSYYIIRLEDKTVQPLSEVMGSIVEEVRKNHMDESLKDLNNRFVLQVLRPDFFIQSQKAGSGR